MTFFPANLELWGEVEVRQSKVGVVNSQISS